MTAKQIGASHLMEMVESYRTAGGRAEHSAKKERLMFVFQEIEQRLMLEPMQEVADRYAHRLAMMLECVLCAAPPSQRFYNEAMTVLGEYRAAMNAIHERESPTFIGEPIVHRAQLGDQST